MNSLRFVGQDARNVMPIRPRVEIGLNLNELQEDGQKALERNIRQTTLSVMVVE
jgi:hypothetical protein